MLSELFLMATLGTEPDSLRYNGRMGELEVSPPKLVDPGINVDGLLDEQAWTTAAILGGFTQYVPVEGVEPSEATEIRVFYTDEAIYFGIRAYDSDPGEILARFGERDRVTYNDDWVRIILDTFDDRRQAYAFAINPLGLQSDGLIVEGGTSGFGGRSGWRWGRSGGGGGGGSFGGRVFQVDFNPDFIWDSEGIVDSEGWTGEIRIPYVSLRFREIPEQAWGIQVTREVKRTRFRQSWAPLTKDISSSLGQSGRLVGLQEIQPRRLIELNPVATGVRTGTNTTGAFLKNDPDGEFGFNTRIGVTQNMVLMAPTIPIFRKLKLTLARSQSMSGLHSFSLKRDPFSLTARKFSTHLNGLYTLGKSLTQ
ncbi:MAG: hypothetical protein CM1200mP14_22160 [Gammaproteobacteria bacterium]|nr:MAG: hypothetical protein CM1200mP14_22160 [Gammaproteobacteria bacterium]